MSLKPKISIGLQVLPYDHLEEDLARFWEGSNVLRLSLGFRSMWCISSLLASSSNLRGRPTCLLGQSRCSAYLLWQWMIEIIVDFASFKWLPICVCNLPSLCINITIIKVSAKYLHLKVLGIEDIIISEFVMLEKCKDKVD